MGIGPSTKETSLHHFRDPLVDIVGSDEGIDLMGVLLFGTADDNVDKIRNSTRAAIVAECMRADGVIVSSDGWGNSDVDYVNCVKEQHFDLCPTTLLFPKPSKKAPNPCLARHDMRSFAKPCDRRRKPPSG